MEILNSPLGKLAISLVLLAALAPVVVWFFRSTWAELEAEAAAARKAREKPRAKSRRPAREGRDSVPEVDEGFAKVDLRLPVTFLLGALGLLLINYYGSFEFFDGTVRPLVRDWSNAHGQLIDFGTYEDLSWRVYWGCSRYLFYLLPLIVWPFVFKENPLDFGLRFRGFREHAWIYLLCLVIVIPTLRIVSYSPEFNRYYPMYQTAGRSWLDFWIWEGVYIGQFFVLEVFFRGFWLRGARSLGVGAIFSMIVPYVMIHFPKPYLEACGAIVAGTVLGSLSMKTGSIWAGFLIHSTVAILMDLLALEESGRLPIRLTPYASTLHKFPYTHQVLWTVWTAALLGLVYLLYRKRRSAAGRG
jgi:Type II CAAX prenyl endopeptidase Rce1-like